MSLNDLFLHILWLPEQASTIAPVIDHLHFWVIGVTMLASTACGGTAYYCIARYRWRGDPKRTERVTPPRWFEAAAIVGPLSLFLLWWAVGFRDFVDISTPPPDCFDVYVTAKQWMWKFSYPGGPNAIDTLHVPAGRPVRLLMTSRDVIHSFYVPAFRIKQDVLPGRNTQIWFQAVYPGKFQILCAELCGPGHSGMWAEVVVHDPAEFEAWLATERRGLERSRDVGQTDSIPADADLPRQGARVAAEAGCLKCHSIDGTAHIGPTFLDLYLRREPMQDGSVLVADEAYLTESIVDPMARVVSGFEPVMPTYQGRLSPPEIGALLEYLRTLKSAAPGAAVARPGVYRAAPTESSGSGKANQPGEPGASPLDPVNGQTPNAVPVVGAPLRKP